MWINLKEDMYEYLDFFNDVNYIKMDGTEVLNMDDISKEEREGWDKVTEKPLYLRSRR